jgi:hypothetical protein
MSTRELWWTGPDTEGGFQVSRQGEQGEQGEQGKQGEQGEQGEQRADHVNTAGERQIDRY